MAFCFFLLSFSEITELTEEHRNKKIAVEIDRNWLFKAGLISESFVLITLVVLLNNVPKNFLWWRHLYGVFMICYIFYVKVSRVQC